MSGFEEELLVGFGDVVDRIVSTPVGTAPVIRKGRGGPAKHRYSWMRVYDEARERYGKPLTLLAAEGLMERVGEGDHVLIVTNSMRWMAPRVPQPWRGPSYWA